MTSPLNSLLIHLLGCFQAIREPTLLVGFDAVKNWPKNALSILIESGLLTPATPAKLVVCDGCEEDCTMRVHIMPGAHPRALIMCDDLGRQPVKLEQLKQWQYTGDQLAHWISLQLGLPKKPEKETTGETYNLGVLQGKPKKGLLKLDIEADVSLSVSGNSLCLIEVISEKNGWPAIDGAQVHALADLPPALPINKKQPARGLPKQHKNTDQEHGLETDSRKWRQQIARNAANVRHNKPGGSRDKRLKIRKLWATGKYSSRDRCAEEECAALDMSFSVARKALRNTPDP